MKMTKRSKHIIQQCFPRGKIIQKIKQGNTSRPQKWHYDEFTMAFEGELIVEDSKIYTTNKGHVFKYKFKNQSHTRILTENTQAKSNKFSWHTTDKNKGWHQNFNLGSNPIAKLINRPLFYAHEWHQNEWF